MKWLLLVPVYVAQGWFGLESRVIQIPMETGPACVTAAGTFAPDVRGRMTCINQSTGEVLVVLGLRK